MGLFDLAEAHLAGLAVRVAALEGGTAEPPVDPPVEPPVTYTPSPALILRSGDVVQGKSFTGYDYAINAASGAYNQAVTNAAVRDSRFDGCKFGVKVGTGPISSGIALERLVARDCRIPLMLADMQDSTLTDLDLEGRPGSTTDHCLYLERGIKRMTGRNIRLTQGGGYCLHMYNPSDVPGEDITLEDVTLDATGGWLPLVIMGFRRVALRRVKLITQATDGPCIMLGGCDDVLIEDFEASGGYSLVYSHGGCSGVVIRNGTYPAGKPLILGTTAGVTFEGVMR